MQQWINKKKLPFAVNRAVELKTTTSVISGALGILNITAKQQ
jgi:hypothetical protein